jgi:hypothetical protein
MAVTNTLRLSTQKLSFRAVDVRLIINASSNLQQATEQDSNNVQRRDQPMAEVSNKPMNAFTRDQVAKSRPRPGVKVKPLMDVTTTRLRIIGNAEIVIVMVLDIRSMASIIRSAIVVARMRTIPLDSTRLLGVLEVGLVSREGNLLSRGDSRRQGQRNLVVEVVDLRVGMVSLLGRNMAVEEGLGVAIENLRGKLSSRGDLRSLREKNMTVEEALGASIRNHLDRNMAVGVGLKDIKSLREVDMWSLRTWAMAMGMRLDGVRGRGKKSIERKLLKNRRRSARRSTEKRDGRKKVVVGFLRWECGVVTIFG